MRRATIRGGAAAAGVAIALLAVLPSPARAQFDYAPNSWHGPLPGLSASSGAQWVRVFAFGPPGTMYAGAEGGGVYRSLSGGATWEDFNAGFPGPKSLNNIRALMASSTSPTVWAGNDTGVWKNDGGSWQPIAQGPQPDPAKPTKLNESVQSLIGLTGGSTMLAGVFSGGVFRSTDGGETWSPPPANSGMPSSESVYGLLETVPGGPVYATAGSGVYVSFNQGSSWTRISDGIPGSASGITTWAYPQHPNVLFTSTGSAGIYRSLNAGVTWAPINDGLLASRARGFAIFPGEKGVHLYAATENALWQALQSYQESPVPGGTPETPAPRWRPVTTAGLATSVATNEIMWSLTAPVIPSQGAPGLIAGTQSDGGFFIAFQPPGSACPTANPQTSPSLACPAITDLTPQVGQELNTVTGSWTGTEVIDLAFQWQRCTGPSSGCSDIEDANERSYIVPVPESGPLPYYRVKVTATNPAPSFDLVVRYSRITSQTTDPDNYPGFSQRQPPSVGVLAPGSSTSPQVGDTVTALKGTLTLNDPTYGWFSPDADSVSYQWLRCPFEDINDCEEIAGATNRDHTLTPAEGNGYVKVRVVGRNNTTGGLGVLVSPESYYITSLPAAIADPFVGEDGQLKSQAPSLMGEAYVGETLAGSVGGFRDPSTVYEKTWHRCDADGGACSSPIYQDGTVDNETGSTYTIRPGDLGYTIRMRVTADVNGDTLHNAKPDEQYFDTPATPVVTHRPVPPPPGGPAPPGNPPVTVDSIAPTILGASLSAASFTQGRGTTFVVRASEAGSVRIVISRATTGRLVRKRCRPLTRSNRRRKRCTYQKTITTLRRSFTAPGTVSVRFNGKVGRRVLAPGTYRATIVITDAAGNASKARVLTFKVRRKRR